MMKLLAQEHAGAGIRISVAPGATRTRINGAAVRGGGGREMLRLIPCARMGEVDGIARAVRWLVSDKADHVVGVTLRPGQGNG